MGNNQSSRKNPGQAEWGGIKPEYWGLMFFLLWKEEQNPVFLQQQDQLWLFLKHSSSQGTAASILVATGSQGTEVYCYWSFWCLLPWGKKANLFRHKAHRWFKSTEVILRDLLPNFRAQHHWNRGLLAIQSLQVNLKVVCSSYPRKKTH